MINRCKIIFLSNCFLLMFVFVLFFECTVAAEESKIMRVGWHIQQCYQEILPTGEHYGYNHEYLMRISQYTGWDYKFIEIDSFTTGYEMIKKGEIDILGYVLRTDDRIEEVNFPELSCGTVATNLFVHKDSDIAYYDFKAFDGMDVASINTKNPDYLLQFAKENNFSVNIKLYDNNTQTIEAVESGEVDAGIIAGYQPNNKTRIVASISPKPFYFALNKNDVRALGQMNMALNNILLETPFYEEDLSSKYLHEQRDTIHLTKEEKEFISKNQIIEVSYSSDWFPITYSDPKTGEFRGIAADIFKRISDITGLRFNYIKAKDAENYASESQIKASALYDFALAYNEGYRLTNSYLNVPLVLVSKSDLPEEEPLTAAVVHHLYNKTEIDQLKNADIKFYNTFEQCLDAVNKGDANISVINAYAAEHLLKISKFQNLNSNILYNEGYAVCIAIAKKLDPRINSIINKTISLMPSADINAMIYKNIDIKEKININAILSQMPPDVIALAASVLIIVMALMSIILYRQRKYADYIKKLLFTDELTGLSSHKGFESEALSSIENHAGKKFIVDLDINFFGEYNDINGYNKGNELLITLARTIKEDCNPKEWFARIQADHFVCLILSDNIENVWRRAANWQIRFREAMESSSLLISFGIFEVKNKEMGITKMCDCALAAKRTIKGNYEHFIGVYDEVLRKKQLDNMDILDKFETALIKGEFIHYFQPKYDIITQKVVGAEALVRWLASDGEMIMPGRFIELFETNGLINRLDLHMFEKLCKKISGMVNSGIKPLPISINFSRAYLFDNIFLEKLIGIVDKHGVSTSFIEIEITETAFMDNFHEMKKTIDRLHSVGFIVSIDDFGSGFSSLNLLKDVRFDVIKLDRAFLSSAGETERGEKVISNVVSLAHDLNMKTVAEGVEIVEQFEILKSCGCDMVQGYFFSKPLPESIYDKLMKEHSN